MTSLLKKPRSGQAGSQCPETNYTLVKGREKIGRKKKKRRNIHSRVIYVVGSNHAENGRSPNIPYMETYMRLKGMMQCPHTLGAWGKKQIWQLFANFHTNLPFMHMQQWSIWKRRDNHFQREHIYSNLYKKPQILICPALFQHTSQ